MTTGYLIAEALAHNRNKHYTALVLSLLFILHNDSTAHKQNIFAAVAYGLYHKSSEHFQTNNLKAIKQV